MKIFEFYSPLSKKEVYLTLKNLTNPDLDCYSFYGTFCEDSFKLRRYKFFSGRNSIKPKLVGTVTETENGTKISIKLALRKLDKIFLFIWFAIYCCFLLLLFFTAIIERDFTLFSPIFGASLIFLVPYSAFYFQGKSAVKLLKEHLSK